MKKVKLLLIIIILTISHIINAQVAINSNGALADASSILEVTSSVKGILLPRLTTDQRNAIASPAIGLLIFNTDYQVLQIYITSGWQSLEKKPCAPGQPGSISGNNYMCGSQSSLPYSITAISNATNYNWTVPDGSTILSGQGTTAITANIGTQSGNISVRAESGCGNSNYENLYITVNNSIPAQPSYITGNASPICNATGIVYSIAAVSGASSYTWTVPSGATIVDGQGTISTTVNFGIQNGNISVRAENTCGTSAFEELSVTLLGPAHPGIITGNASPDCNASGIVYSIAAVTGAGSYTWVVPPGATIVSGQGTTSITVNFSTQNGNVSVRAENVCGNSSYEELPIILTGPAQPIQINGAPVVPQFTVSTYFITAVTGAISYHWTAPSGAIIISGQGTTSVQIQFTNQSGFVSVRAENACGNSAYQTLLVAVI